MVEIIEDEVCRLDTWGAVVLWIVGDDVVKGLRAIDSEVGTHWIPLGRFGLEEILRMIEETVRLYSGWKAGRYPGGSCFADYYVL